MYNTHCSGLCLFTLGSVHVMKQENYVGETFLFAMIILINQEYLIKWDAERGTKTRTGKENEVPKKFDKLCIQQESAIQNICSS